MANAQNVTGEVLMEVSGGKQQQLRTARNAATHREAGSDTATKFPVYQHYVQHFEK
jgi:hypothetical protein